LNNLFKNLFISVQNTIKYCPTSTTTLDQYIVLPSGFLASLSIVHNRIDIYNVFDQKLVSTIPIAKSNSMVLLPNSNLLATGANDGNVYLYNYQTFKSEGTFKGINSSPISKLIILNTGYLAGSVERDIVIWNVDGTVQKTISNTHYGSIVDMINLNYNYLATSSSDRTIKVWNILNSSLLKTLSGHANSVTLISYIGSKNSLTGHLVSSSLDGTMKFWNVETGKVEVSIQKNRIYSCSVFPDNETIMIGLASSLMEQWTLSNYTLVKSHVNSNVNSYSYPVRAMGFLPNGDFITGGTSTYTNERPCINSWFSN
jgi:WD40 repeat protein